MKKRVIIIPIIILVLLILLIDHGWRLFGFDGCSPPSWYAVTDLKVTDDRVKIKKTTYRSADHYAGYITDIEDHTLYIGVKYQLITVFGGFFDIDIPVNDVDIEKIYIKGNGASELIWEKDKEEKNQ